MSGCYRYADIERAEVITVLPPETRTLLDVGCGRGSFGRRVRSELGAEVWGIDSAESVAEVARARLDRFFLGRFEEVLGQLPSGYFDVITFLDVLEHMTDPWQTVRSVARCLRPGGRVVVSVPNIRYWPVLKDLLLMGRWEYTDTGVLDRTHLRFFTKQTIANLLRDSGYEVERLQGINPMRFRRLAIVNWLTGGRLSDMRFLQFLVVARAVQ